MAMGMGWRPRACRVCRARDLIELCRLPSLARHHCYRQTPSPTPHPSTWTRRSGPSVAEWLLPRLEGFPLACTAASVSSAAGSGGEGKGRKKKGGRKRLDELCRESFPQHSRSLLQSWIMQGKVAVDGRTVTKSGYLVSSSSKVSISAQEPKYVCRAGLKMEKALQAFDVEVAGKVALDSGLSTGGFTDCLLQNGCDRVYGVDVGYGQVAEKIRTDPRVVVMERTNFRHLSSSDLPETVQIVSLDLSFISILKVRRRANRREASSRE